ncbi:MAG: hypothetical protein ACOY8P_12370 [Thermodesulfobacteriota bacterium]
MAGDSLQTIVEAEQELLAALAEERERIAAWLAGQRAAIDREGEARAAAFRERCRLADNAAREVAAREAAVAVEQARRAVARLGELDDAILERIVVRHLRTLLPRESP